MFQLNQIKLWSACKRKMVEITECKKGRNYQLQGCFDYRDLFQLPQQFSWTYFSLHPFLINLKKGNMRTKKLTQKIDTGRVVLSEKEHSPRRTCDVFNPWWDRTVCQVCVLPKSLRSLETQDTKPGKDSWGSPATKRSDRSWTTLLSQVIPGKQTDANAATICIFFCVHVVVFDCVFVPTASSAKPSSKGLMPPEESSSNWAKMAWKGKKR